ncbi:hypothetical protein [Kitasatospora purpeofusca]|uniref:hypothetical protein n=1 Tax=Kitasatospora purpeofusca TaxID=67352 RepID=UPI003F4AA791
MPWYPAAMMPRRHHADSLAPMRVGHPEQDTTAIDSTSISRLLDGVARTGSTTALRGALPDALPWVTFLPAEDVDLLIGELVDAARHTVPRDDLAPIAVLLTQWHHTAEVHADPALHTALTQEAD